MNSLKTFSGALLIITLYIIIIEANEKTKMGVHHPNKAANVGIIGKTSLKSNERATQRHEYTPKKFDISESKPSTTGNDELRNDQFEIHVQIPGQLATSKKPYEGKEGSRQEMQSVKDEVDGMKTKFEELVKRMNELQAKGLTSEENTKEKLDELEKIIDSLKSKPGKEPAIDIEDKVDSAIEKELSKRMKEMQAVVKQSIEETKDKLDANLEKEKKELREAINQSAQCEAQIEIKTKIGKIETANKCYWVNGGKSLLAFVGYGLPRQRLDLSYDNDKTFAECVKIFRKKRESDSEWSTLVYRAEDRRCYTFKGGKGFCPGDRSDVFYQVEVVQLSPEEEKKLIRFSKCSPIVNKYLLN